MWKTGFTVMCLVDLFKIEPRHEISKNVVSVTS